MKERAKFQLDEQIEYKKDKQLETGNFPLSIRMETQKEAWIKEKLIDAEKFKKMGFDNVALGCCETILLKYPKNEEAKEFINKMEAVNKG